METTREILNELHKTLWSEYKRRLESFPMKPTVRETLLDGFIDGCRTGIHHTVEMLGVTVKESE